MKKYRVINRKHFIAFLSVLMIIMTFLVLSVFNISSAEDIDRESCIEVEIQQGDTLWALAGTYADTDRDIREVVYDICRINDIKASDLRPGQTILVPLE